MQQNPMEDELGVTKSENEVGLETPLLIPVQTSTGKIFLSHRHKHVFPPEEQQFGHRFASNECPEITLKKSNSPKAPKVTVYMPAFNAGKYIEKAIESALEQTMQDFELVIINDGSTDGTGLVLKKYEQHPKIRIYHQNNQGIGAASNKALLHARGEYICQLDSDDVLHREALRALSYELDSNPHIGLVYARHYEWKKGEIFTLHTRPYQPGSLLLSMIASHPRMWRKSCFQKTEGFDECLLNAVDYDIVLKLEEVCDVKKIDRLLYWQRLHGTNTSIVSNIQQRKNSVIAINKALKRRGVDLKAVDYKKNVGGSTSFYNPQLNILL